jgi:hypothetical protein
MSNSNHEAITNTNSKRVSIIKDSGDRYLILNQSDGLRPVWIAGGLGAAMDAAYGD